MPKEEFGAEVVNLASNVGVKEFELGDSAVRDAELKRVGLKTLTCCS